VADVTSVIAGSLAYGVTAITVSALGVEPQSLVYATMGAGVGTIAAPALGRIRAIAIFACVVCLCALGGTVLAQEYFADRVLARNLASGGLAAFFHPLFAIALTKLADVVTWCLKRIGVNQ